jgi:hypothetical protein
MFEFVTEAMLDVSELTVEAIAAKSLETAWLASADAVIIPSVPIVKLEIDI